MKIDTNTQYYLAAGLGILFIGISIHYAGKNKKMRETTRNVKIAELANKEKTNLNTINNGSPQMTHTVIAAANSISLPAGGIQLIKKPNNLA